MHNIYVTLSSLHSLDGLIILRDISFKKPKLKKGLLEMIKPISPKNVNKNDTLENTPKPNFFTSKLKKILKYRMIQIMTLLILMMITNPNCIKSKPTKILKYQVP
jgi:hypothetical protein